MADPGNRGQQREVLVILITRIGSETRMITACHIVLFITVTSLTAALIAEPLNRVHIVSLHLRMVVICQVIHRSLEKKATIWIEISEILTR